jgi:hypothetical protein
VVLSLGEGRAHTPTAKSACGTAERRRKFIRPVFDPPGVLVLEEILSEGTSRLYA